MVLEFDHLDPKEKRDHLSRMIAGGCAWSTIEREIAKCEVVCANCHRHRTARTYGSYRLVGLPSVCGVNGNTAGS